MMKTFTENDVILYLYGEMTPQQGSDFKLALQFNESLKTAYEEFAAIYGMVDNISYEPSKQCKKTLKTLSNQTGIQIV